MVWVVPSFQGTVVTRGLPGQSYGNNHAEVSRGFTSIDAMLAQRHDDSDEENSNWLELQFRQSDEVSRDK
jgi:hypothetical protein